MGTSMNSSRCCFLMDGRTKQISVIILFISVCMTVSMIVQVGKIFVINNQSMLPFGGEQLYDSSALVTMIHGDNNNSNQNNHSDHNDIGGRSNQMIKQQQRREKQQRAISTSLSLLSPPAIEQLNGTSHHGNNTGNSTKPKKFIRFIAKPLSPSVQENHDLVQKNKFHDNFHSSSNITIDVANNEEKNNKETQKIQEPSTGTREIPHKILFTYKTDLLQTKKPVQLYENALNTIRTYREAWGEPDATVWFLTDEDCEKVIKSIEPDLLPFFQKEKRGMYKADICRIAALYQQGGYYFDVDIQALKAVPIPDKITFTTVKERNHVNFFQAFIASSPKHPILKKALDLILKVYTREHRLHGLLGTSTMGDAYIRVATEYHVQNRPRHFYFLDEMNLSPDKPNMYSHIARRQGRKGCCCNFVVHDVNQKEVYFYSRIIGSRECY